MTKEKKKIRQTIVQNKKKHRKSNTEQHEKAQVI